MFIKITRDTNSHSMKTIDNVQNVYSGYIVSNETIENYEAYLLDLHMKVAKEHSISINIGSPDVAYNIPFPEHFEAFWNCESDEEVVKLEEGFEKNPPSNMKYKYFLFDCEDTQRIEIFAFNGYVCNNDGKTITRI